MKAPAFPFVLEFLEPVAPYSRPMFGCTAVYIGEKIVLALRDRPTERQCNGIWIATTSEHHASLKQDLPGLCSISVLGPGVTGWQMIRSSDPDFESQAETLCDLIRRGDPRIGKTPERKRRKGAKA